MEKIELKIIELASSGKGVGIKEEEGYKRSVFVPMTVPGDIVQARITKQHKRYYEAELIEVVEPSKDRVKPVCRHFGVCGACDYLHIRYERQLESKKKLMEMYLSRSDIEADIEVIEAPSPLGYRDKVRAVGAPSGIGFFARKSNEVAVIKHCDIIREELNKIFKWKPRTGEQCFGYDYKTKSVKRSICHYYYKDMELAYNPSSFVQANLEMNSMLIDEAARHVKGSVLDLYAGNGNFSIPLNCKVAVEGSSKGYKLLCENIKNNKSKVRPINDDVKEYVKRADRYDTLILDPPRTGAPEIIEDVCRIAERVIYISCNARQLSKELKKYIQSGFKLNKLIMFDMFPNTRHFETMAILDSHSKVVNKQKA